MKTKICENILKVISKETVCCWGGCDIRAAEPCYANGFVWTDIGCGHQTQGQTCRSLQRTGSNFHSKHRSLFKQHQTQTKHRVPCSQLLKTPQYYNNLNFQIQAYLVLAIFWDTNLCMCSIVVCTKGENQLVGVILLWRELSWPSSS